MTPRALPQEIWEFNILPRLKKPIPAPLSKVPPSDITQGDICSLMRTCKMFYSICEKLLYTRIVTNAFPLLLRNVHLPSMRRHLSLTTALLIEYSPKGLDASYQDIVKRGGDAWLQVGRSAKEMKKEIRRGCEAEIGEMWTCLGWLRDSPAMAVKVFPNLKTIAVASIEGKPDNRWKEYDDLHRSDHNKMWATQMAKGCFDQLLHELGTSGKFRHLCVRDASGLMSTPSITMASHVAPIYYSRTIHIPPLATEADVAMPFGAPVRWITDNPQHTPWQVLRKCIGDTFTEIVGLRNQDDGRKRLKTDSADLELYCSSPIKDAESVGEATIDQWMALHPGQPRPEAFTVPVGTLSEAEQRKVTADTGLMIQNILRDQSGLEDRIKWYPIADAPVCLACGSGPPELRGD